MYPGDFRTLGGERASAPPRRPVVERQAYRPPDKSALSVSLLVLKHSFVVFMVLLAAGFVLGFFLVGAFFSGGEAGLYVATGVVYAVEALLFIWGGYRISMEAMEKDHGWIYGTACVAAVVFFWQPLVSFFLQLAVSDRVVVPQTFSLVGIMVALFLFLPLGALGGWLVEKRYLG